MFTVNETKMNIRITKVIDQLQKSRMILSSYKKFSKQSEEISKIQRDLIHILEKK